MKKLPDASLVPGVAAAGLLGLLATSNAFASTQLPLGTVVTGMGAYATGAYIHFAAAMPALEGCSATQYELFIDFGSTDGKSMYATALAAFLSGRPLGFGVSGCSPTNTAMIYRVDIG